MSFDPIQYDTMSDAMWERVYLYHVGSVGAYTRIPKGHAALHVDYIITMHLHHLKQMEHQALLAELRRATIECLTKSNGAPAVPPSRT